MISVRRYLESVWFYVSEKNGLNFTMNSVLGQNESIHYESVHEAWVIIHEYRENVTKDLQMTIFKDLQSNILGKAIH